METQIKIMQIGNGREKEVVEITNCRIIYKNFEGRKSMYNNEGDRNFAIVIDDEASKEILLERGFNVKMKVSQDENSEPTTYLPVKLKWSEHDGNIYGPNIIFEMDGAQTHITPETAKTIDKSRIDYCNFYIRPYDWEVNGRTGTSAWLDTAFIAALPTANPWADPSKM